MDDRVANQIVKSTKSSGRETFVFHKDCVVVIRQGGIREIQRSRLQITVVHRVEEVAHLLLSLS
jgi:hypothetical protein